MPNPDFPATIRQKSFILDYDAFYEGEIDEERTVQSYLIELHNNIEQLFESSLREPLMAKMGMIINA